ncbi:MAG: DNA recombination protein RmuC [Ignavibacteria bacterium]
MEYTLLILVALIIGGVIGFGIGFLYLKSKFATGFVREEEFKLLAQEKDKFGIEVARLNERVNILEKELETKRNELETIEKKFYDASNELSKITTINNTLREKLEEQKAELLKLQESFRVEFENLANRIFDEKTQSFKRESSQSIEQILNPLKENIKKFEDAVRQTSLSEREHRQILIEEIKHLKEANQKITEEANNLVQALKGDSRTQGNWGELILEKILERSGLVRDREYTIQESKTDETGRRLRPDVIIHLPENRSIIIDSKVSLRAYERYWNEDDPVRKQSYLAEHIAALRNHIKTLDAKQYQNLYGLQTVDFIIMFMPIEPALSLAVQADLSLWNDAFEKQIVIVGPSTLLATLRTIANIWKQEKQNRNALAIADQSGKLYQKMRGVLEDLLNIGKKLDDAKSSYESAVNKLSRGRGNVISQLEKIKELGAKTENQLPPEILNNAEIES